jgi:hypothetical protein
MEKPITLWKETAMKSWKAISISRLVIIWIVIFLISVFLFGTPRKARGEEINLSIEKEMVVIRDCFKQKKYLETIKLCNETIQRHGDKAIEAAAVRNLSIRHIENNSLEKAEKYYKAGDYLRSICTSYATILFLVRNDHPPSQKIYDMLDKAKEAYFKTLPGSI